MKSFKIFICLCFQLIAISFANNIGPTQSQKIKLQVFNDHVLINEITLNEYVSFYVVNIGEHLIVTDTTYYRAINLTDKNNQKGLSVTNSIEASSIDFPLKPILIYPGDKVLIKIKSPDFLDIQFVILNFVYMISRSSDFTLLNKDDFLMNSNKLGLKIDL